MVDFEICRSHPICVVTVYKSPLVEQMCSCRVIDGVDLITEQSEVNVNPLLLSKHNS